MCMNVNKRIFFSTGEVLKCPCITCLWHVVSFQCNRSNKRGFGSFGDWMLNRLYNYVLENGKMFVLCVAYGDR